MAIVNDEAFVAGTADGEIGGAFGALGFLNDLLAEWIEGRWRARRLEGELDIGRFDLAAGRSRRGNSGGGSGKPECAGIQGQEAGRRRGGVAELEAQFNGGDLWRRARQQQVGIANGVKSGRAAESAAQFMAARDDGHLSINLCLRGGSKESCTSYKEKVPE